MTSFMVENPTSLSNTCKFWKLVSKNEELEDHYIGYTQGAACRWEESDGKTSYRYSNIDIEEFVKSKEIYIGEKKYSLKTMSDLSGHLISKYEIHLFENNVYNL